jgi:tetratricopeptide (TPR) repeat protein
LQQLYQEGTQAYSTADYATALEKWQAALQQAQTLKNPQYSSQLLMNIGVVHWFLANYEEALEFFLRRGRFSGSLAMRKARGRF